MRRLPVTSLLLLFASLLIAPPVSAACPPDSPEAVLDCLAQAYADRDLDLYASLLADDFVFEQTDMNATWDRKQDLAATRRLFESPEVDSLTLVIDQDESGSIEAGSQPGVFIIDGVSSWVEIRGTEGGRPKHYTVTNKGMELWVRSDGEGEPYRIVRWVRAFEGD